LSRKTEHERARDERSDEELIAAIRDTDDGDGFAVLYERYYQRVYKFVFMRLGNRAEAEEAVQEAFTAIFQSVSAYRGRSQALSWIYGIAKNTVNNHIRRAAAYERRIDGAEQALARTHARSGVGTPEDALALRRCAESVRSEFDAITGWQSEIFEMRHIDNLPIAEISARTSRSRDAVRSSLRRVKRRIVSAVENRRDDGFGSVGERSLA
jgi:RNA polymerase sigma-70 factor (ECF subfamily)